MNTQRYVAVLEETRTGAIASVERKLRDDFGDDTLVELLTKLIKKKITEVISVVPKDGIGVILEVISDKIGEVAAQILNILRHSYNAYIYLRVERIEA